MTRLRRRVPTLDEATLAALLAPYLETPLDRPGAEASGATAGLLRTVCREDLYRSLLRYLELLVKWNARTNLTAVRTREGIVTRHFGESLFAARCIEALTQAKEVLDFGSGAGFPGIPVQIHLPAVLVTLAESQSKKAAFLREAVRELEMRARIWNGRVGDLPAEAAFDLVTTRAVDDPARARMEAWERVRPGGWLLEMDTLRDARPQSPDVQVVRMPETLNGVVVLTRKAGQAL